jgi:hypothetical protein
MSSISPAVGIAASMEADDGRDRQGDWREAWALTRSRQIAGVLGPTVIVLALSEAKNVGIWATGIAPLTYLAGLLWFLGGLVVVRLHNQWSTSWPVTITLVGWFFMVGGLFRLFFPEAQQGNQNTPAIGIYALDGVLVALGALMTFKASGHVDRGETR